MTSSAFFVTLNFVSERKREMSKLQPLLRSTCQFFIRRHVGSVANISSGSGVRQHTDAFDLMRPSLTGLMEDIHSQLERDLVLDTELGELSR